MSRPKMPPTPASSAEIKGQDHSNKPTSLQLAFELPPSAMVPSDDSRLAGPGAEASPISPASQTAFPTQPSETVKSRRRSSTVQQKETFALPPPPTRSRKIIQMKPRPQEDPSEPSGSSKTTSTDATKNAGGAGGTKKKQPSATSAAGRKIARKTAHSLIERRRRSKMNEEFAVLKGLIPACEGEMHKLAILQASIEYVRYLEDCVSKLKNQQDGQVFMPSPSEFRLSASRQGQEACDENDEDEGVGEDGPEDVEMADSEAPSRAFTPTPAQSEQSPISPVILAQDARGRQHSSSSISTDFRQYGYSHSSTTSPVVGPQSSYGYQAGTRSGTHSALTSPALRPQLELDQEASAALLMLNADRRAGTSSSGGPGRGMSVRDLLSS